MPFSRKSDKSSIFIIKIKKLYNPVLFNAFVLIDKGEKFAILPDGAHC